jgi:hypothetical protein
MAAFVSSTTGVASRSVTVPAGTDRLLVAIALSSASTAARTATYNGVSMSVATTANGWVQIFYTLAPTVGSATLAVSGSNISEVIAAHYTGVGSFQSGQQASTASASFSPSWGGVIVFGMVAGTTSHTPLASTTERLDSGGDYYADRIVTGSGSVNVGVSSATDPDYAGAIFLDSVLASGTPTAPAPAAAGAATITVAASGTATAPHPTASGSASVNVVSVSGSVTAALPSVGGLAEVVVSVSGAVSAPSPDADGRVSAATHPHAEASLPGPTSSVTIREPTARYAAPRARGSVTEN